MTRRILDRDQAPVGPELVEGLGRGEAFSCWYTKSRRTASRRKPPVAQVTPARGTARRIAGRYELLVKLGSGGMGEVWAARDKHLHSHVAVKLLRPELQNQNPEAKVRFSREAMVLSRLRSPHVVELYDYGTDGGVPYMVMELCEGTSLRDTLAHRGWLTASEVRILVADIAQGLAAVHAEGIVHRDLKPSNVIICDQHVDPVAKIIDFGVARPPASSIHMTGTRMLGSVPYLSPEQCLGETVDRCADLWALAVIAFRALTGSMPFDAQGLGPLMQAILNGSPPAPSSLVPELGDGVDAFFARAFARDPAIRFGDALQMAELLQRALAPLCSGEHLRSDLGPC
ncbi:MAG: serine/threonine protein kinase [Myxococcales bacterium]|nr:serine/threonine protein kinase [Myxococcales bacterium]